MTSLKLPDGIHTALAGLLVDPQADLETLRVRWKVVTLKTAKARETEAAKLLRFIVDLHAALVEHPRPQDYHIRPGEIVRDSILVAVGIEGDPNPKLPVSWLDALRPVWQSWLETDTAKKRTRGTAGQGRDLAGKFTRNPKHEGEFTKGNPHRFKKKQIPKK